VRNRIISISLAVVLALSMGLMGCGSEEVPEYDLTISSTEGGSVTSPGEGTFSHNEGDLVNLAAKADEGYRFVNWTGDIDDIADVEDATTTITMNDNYSITANFVVIPLGEYGLIISSTAGGEVTTPGEGSFAYDEGETVNLVAEADEGYQFVNWTGDVSTIANVNATSTTITMNANYSIKANFEETPPIQYNLTITSTAGGSVTTPGQGTFTYDAGMVVSMVATPAGGYRFAGWTGDVGTLSCGCQSTNITMNGNYSVMANFEVIPVTYYTLTLGTNGSGSMSPSAGQHSYIAGTVVSINATPASCYSFVNWTGDVGTVGNVNTASTTVRMNGPYSITANFGQGEAVDFPDPNLESAIRRAIGKPTGCIYRSDLVGLTNFNAAARNIADLTGLEYCTNLTFLLLSGNAIIDTSPLANLTNLTFLTLYENGIIDIYPLASLTHLSSLYLWSNRISDISALANLTSLTRLDLGFNQISDISPLANLTNLTELDLGWNHISDISPLVDLTSLSNLSLDGSQISDISLLATLTNLKVLSLVLTGISDISPLASLASLGSLVLNNNRISDISPLANLTNLTYLELDYSQVSDISLLANLTNLRYLDLQ
jgi:Leucine-rich repeat (LRR) protein